MTDLFHWNISIAGKVQGVYFRASIQEIARQLNIKGFVRNEADGSVYAEAEGNLEQLSNFKAWCEKGPVRSKVEKVDTKDGELQHFHEFTIH